LTPKIPPGYAPDNSGIVGLSENCSLIKKLGVLKKNVYEIFWVFQTAPESRSPHSCYATELQVGFWGLSGIIRLFSNEYIFLSLFSINISMYPGSCADRIFQCSEKWLHHSIQSQKCAPSTQNPLKNSLCHILFNFSKNNNLNRYTAKCGQLNSTTMMTPFNTQKTDTKQLRLNGVIHCHFDDKSYLSVKSTCGTTELCLFAWLSSHPLVENIILIKVEEISHIFKFIKYFFFFYKCVMERRKTLRFVFA